MSKLVYNIKIPSGVTIDDAAKEASRLAGILNQSVLFEFNDRVIDAVPGETPESIVARYYEHFKVQYGTTGR